LGRSAQLQLKLQSKRGSDGKISLNFPSAESEGEIYPELNNLFDSNHCHNAGYPMTGVLPQVGLKVSF
jgi:hypothetical protein